MSTTGRTVQGWSADEVTDDNDDDTYQSFEWTFCTRVHLVNLKTGKVLGGMRTRPAPSSACRLGSVYSLLNLLEPISKSSEEDNEAGELDKAEEVLSVVLPADEDATLPLYPGEEALDEPAPLVTA